MSAAVPPLESQTDGVSPYGVGPPEVIDATPDEMVREHFIPLSKSDLLYLLRQRPGLDAAEQRQLVEFARMVEATFHYEHHDTIEKIKHAYAYFDPDADTRHVTPPQKNDDDVLFSQIGKLLRGANYRKLEQFEIDKALDAASNWGLNLKVDFSIFERLEFWVRGYDVDHRPLRSWRTRYRKKMVEVPIFRRLVLIFQLSGDDGPAQEGQIVFKSFKNIPRDDIEMLLPGTRVTMSWLDLSKIWGPTVGGVGYSAWKLLTGALAALTLTIKGFLLLGGILVSTIGYAVKSFMGYLSTKDRYRSEVTKKLYYQNLANNAGVFFRLIDESEEQEYREVLLAYYFLWKEAPAQGWTEKELDEAIEAFLSQVLDLNIDFESDDALAKLERLGILLTQGDLLSVVPVERALEVLDHTWDDYFNYNNGD